MRESRLRALVLHAQYTTRLSFYDDWLDAFREDPRFHVIAIDIVRAGAGRRIRAALSRVDAVILLHSTNCDTLVYLDRHLGILAGRRVPLLSFVGNEVNLPGSPIGEKRRALAAIQPEWIATQLLPEAGAYLFGDLASKAIVAIPHALNPKAFCPDPGAEQRPIDFGARSAHYMPHLGDNDRNRVLDCFSSLRERGYCVDISSSRFDRAGWAGFLNRCKATVGTEAGSWFIERDDALVNAIREYVGKKESAALVIANDSRLRTLGHRLPWWARIAIRRLLSHGPIRIEAGINDTTDFADIQERFFKGRSPSPVYGKCISSRHFEAAGTKTCQIMIRGRFNDILAADRHYIALAGDFSNLDMVLARFADVAERRAIAEEAYHHVHSAHTFEHRTRKVYDLVTAGGRTPEPEPPAAKSTAAAPN